MLMGQSFTTAGVNSLLDSISQKISPERTIMKTALLHPKLLKIREITIKGHDVYEIYVFLHHSSEDRVFKYAGNIAKCIFGKNSEYIIIQKSFNKAKQVYCLCIYETEILI
jgi:hypothetical protein